MKVIILGSGTCVPSLNRNAPGYYLEAEGCRVLVDCGSGTLLQLEKAGMSYKDIDAVFITHAHPDHFADLLPLIHALLVGHEMKRKKDLSLFCAKEFLEYYEKAIAPLLWMSEEFSIIAKEASDEISFGPFHIFSAGTVHSSDSLSYRFENGGKSVVFTGDADYDPRLIAHAHQADLLIADCSFPDSMKAKGHLSAKECGMVAREAEVKKLVLSHLYPSGSPDSERVNESGEIYKGNILLAEDLMEIVL